MSVIASQQSRFIGEQAYAMVSRIGPPVPAAMHAYANARIAVDLAREGKGMAKLRATPQDRMGATSPVAVVGFTCHEETTSWTFCALEAKKAQQHEPQDLPPHRLRFQA
ncbi:hypothetical protein EDC27_0417 [Desulfosoma caldarium]|uniref:Uncharacterized protein n=1 Tax=Desulfosoma caldarium TaxID=610254 RepID=A0A3N1VM78_9BACT|nr:hypothetical protein EDC27_0417 [Desulfosoma caldarium]